MASRTERRLNAADVWPVPANSDRAAVGLRKWNDAANALSPGPDRDFALQFPASADGGAMLRCICGASPFLENCAIADQGFVRDLWESGPDHCVDAIVARLLSLPIDSPEPEVAHALRRARRRIALAVGLADIAGVWSLRQVTGALSDFARAACSVALRTQLAKLSAEGAFAAGNEACEEDSGLIVIGMGKLGGKELNYSSDVDLILLYDPDVAPLASRHAAPSHFMRLARRFVDLLAAPTIEGRVFPVDLRLRPDPVSMPLVISTKAALEYYAKRGQTWERAAMIKARPLAGDIAAGNRFLERLESFVWRDSLDFATVQELHETKRRIDAQHRGGKIGEVGQNLKLGRGGIREIEFFAQAHQLVWGGTDRSLRLIGTCDALAALAAAGRIPDSASEKLSAAYEYLRRVEHRIQMVGDRQTHSLPKREADYESLARFLGYGGSRAFREALTGHLRSVEDQYESFFELPHEMTVASASSALSGRSRGETEERLGRMGYRDPAAAFAIVERWRTGRHTVARDRRAMELFQSLIPSLVIASCGTEDPDLALRRFDELIDRIADAHSVLTLFQANLHVLETVAETMVSAPAIGALLTARPSLLESLLDPDSDSSPPDRGALQASLAATLAGVMGFEGRVQQISKWTHEARFRVGARVLFHALDPLDAAALFSDIADCSIAALAQCASEEITPSNACPAGNGVAILATGHYGRRSLNVDSGVEIAVFEVGDIQGQGRSGRTASAFAQQLESTLLGNLRGKPGWRKIYACTTERPAATYGALHARLREGVWSGRLPCWPRLVCCIGDGAERVSQSMSAALEMRRDPAALRAQAAAALKQVRITRPGGDPQAVAERPGGLADIAVLTHYFRLLHAPEHPAVRSAATAGDVLAELGRSGAIPVDLATGLADAWRLMTRIQTLQSLLDADKRGAATPERLRPSVAEAAGVDNFGDVAARLDGAAAKVRAAVQNFVD
ncbi:MAG: hypothetical protein F4X77_09720 [Acidobacteriia bacterium]|nr:hypothetical protein [Terriglobia bacterium]